MKIIFFDIDGTLANRLEVPESARAAIAQFRAGGGKVFICSGRFRAYAEKNFSAYADGFVCCNGRLAFMGNETIVSKPLEGNLVSDIMKRLEPTGVGYAFYEESTVYFCGPDHIYDECVNVVGAGRVVRGIRPDVIRPYNFDLFYEEKSAYEAAEKAIGDICICNDHAPHPSADVTIRGFDKGDSIRLVLAHLGIKKEDAYAFGDGTNDIGMMKAVGCGIAMGNAKEEVKAASDYVTSAINEDGVKNGMLHFGLIS